MDYKELVSLAQKAKENSYAPYSNFHVGAALLTKGGKVFCAANVENAAYSATICAESSAIVKAVSEGERDFKAIAVISDLDDYTTPCGVCRQRIFEFGDDIDVICAQNPESYTVYKISELLPEGFNYETLMRGTKDKA